MAIGNYAVGSRAISKSDLSVQSVETGSATITGTATVTVAICNSRHTGVGTGAGSGVTSIASAVSSCIGSALITGGTTQITSNSTSRFTGTSLSTGSTIIVTSAATLKRLGNGSPTGTSTTCVSNGQSATTSSCVSSGSAAQVSSLGVSRKAGNTTLVGSSITSSSTATRASSGTCTSIAGQVSSLSSAQSIHSCTSDAAGSSLQPTIIGGSRHVGQSLTIGTVVSPGSFAGAFRSGVGVVIGPVSGTFATATATPKIGLGAHTSSNSSTISSATARKTSVAVETGLPGGQTISASSSLLSSCSSLGSIFTCISSGTSRFNATCLTIGTSIGSSSIATTGNRTGVAIVSGSAASSVASGLSFLLLNSSIAGISVACSALALSRFTGNCSVLGTSVVTTATDVRLANATSITTGSFTSTTAFSTVRKIGLGVTTGPVTEHAVSSLTDVRGFTGSVVGSKASSAGISTVVKSGSAAVTGPSVQVSSNCVINRAAQSSVVASISLISSTGITKRQSTGAIIQSALAVAAVAAAVLTGNGPSTGNKVTSSSSGLKKDTFLGAASVFGHSPIVTSSSTSNKIGTGVISGMSAQALATGQSKKTLTINSIGQVSAHPCSASSRLSGVVITIGNSFQAVASGNKIGFNLGLGVTLGHNTTSLGEGTSQKEANATISLSPVLNTSSALSRKSTDISTTGYSVQSAIIASTVKTSTGVVFGSCFELLTLTENTHMGTSECRGSEVESFSTGIIGVAGLSTCTGTKIACAASGIITGIGIQPEPVEVTADLTGSPIFTIGMDSTLGNTVTTLPVTQMSVTIIT